jgi:uncharacterized membrane protein YraQ (UPF0718 family)
VVAFVFSGIYKRGAGLGPAIAFLYSGPAINVLAIILTARILGWQIGLARAIGAVLFSIVIGLLMHLIFLKEERSRQARGDLQFGEVKVTRPLWKDIVYFFFLEWSQYSYLLIGGKPIEGVTGIWSLIYASKLVD